MLNEIHRASRVHRHRRLRRRVDNLGKVLLLGTGGVPGPVDSSRELVLHEQCLVGVGESPGRLLEQGCDHVFAGVAIVATRRGEAIRQRLEVWLDFGGAVQVVVVVVVVLLCLPGLSLLRTRVHATGVLARFRRLRRQKHSARIYVKRIGLFTHFFNLSVILLFL